MTLSFVVKKSNRVLVLMLVLLPVVWIGGTEVYGVQDRECKLPNIRDELATRVEKDQDARRALVAKQTTGADGITRIPDGLLPKLRKIDQDNSRWLKQQVSQHGWLGKSSVGKQGARDAWLLVQHADQDLKFQKRCLALIEKMPEGEVEPIHLAYLTDRIRNAEGKPQLYGTQVRMVGGQAVLGQVEDPDRLNTRRKQVGMGPIEDYLKRFETGRSEESLSEQASEQNKQDTQPAQESSEFVWDQKAREAYAMKDRDPKNWDMELLRDDMEGYNEFRHLTKPAIRYIPSPVATYDTPGGLCKPIKLEIHGQTLVGHSVGWAKGKFNEKLFQPGDRVQIYLSILVLTDDPGDMNKRATRIVSRNHPHYVASGKVITEIGDVDWVQFALANGSNHAIVSQRVFDLDFGNTIVVLPQKDGSLRFHQLDGPRAISKVFEKNEVDTYLVELAKDEKLIKSVTSDKAIQSK